ncbi:protein NRT1/ PTR FAMILY 8.3-like isoform X2 [Olea europaea var. sylvestris]|uniref:protein NRT1/ PTR FAMILY 8.3-like isoform X2 n=1 Tax=Olea europaea var. sylvestris TaxID=158386 RepID=UPI000C1D7428|nr:protein NRT1/ PTR FAMILY 8.3-like isoform X2 [Olea europaea var. sylvestris]
MGTHEEERLLLEQGFVENERNELYTGDGSVDIKGNRILKRNTGNWRACPFILGTECCERLAYYGIATNLVSYLTKYLHEGNVSAARNGMCTLTLSASVPAFKPAECLDSVCPSATPAQYAVFFFGLYLIALGTGGIKPCVSSFGADQFDDTDSEERVKKGSFFNWFYFSVNIGALISSSLIVWIQDNAGWGLGFGIPAVFMGIAIVSFFSGTSLYRFQKPGGSPITRMCQVLVASCHKWNLTVPTESSLLYETSDKCSAIEGSRKLLHTDELKCLDKAAVVSEGESKTGDYSNPWKLCTVTQVEELKILIRMFPIWATGIVFSAVYAQMSTMFVEQGMVMDTSIGSFTIPAASLSTFDVISVIFWVPVYDKVLVPIARRVTGKGRGFSELQRMGIGLFISVLCMAAAAVVEIKRLQLARELGLVDENVAVPLSIFWQIPQYFLLGAAEVFTFIGQLEFFYDQSPDAMRSLCSALSLLTTSLGNYLSSFILTVVTSLTTRGGNPGWIPDNLNKGHLDYFYWLLAGLSFVNMVVYVFCA